MADGPVSGTEKDILRHIAQDSGDLELETPMEEEERQPVYKQYEDAKIPVSKKAGSLWKSRRDTALSKLERSGNKDNWDEAIRYYKNDQRTNRSGSAAKTRKDRGQDFESENIVFANTSALVPAIYAKNPDCEITPNYVDNNQPEGDDDVLRVQTTIAERLVNVLAARKATPGINLKPKARKAVVMATLTNLAYFEVGYTRREESSEQALADLEATTVKLQEAKDPQEYMEAEGELLALEEKISFLRPSGPWVKFRHPKDVLRDPDATEADLSDSQWIMIADYVSTAYINAVYRTRKSDTEWQSIYKPTHVIQAGGNSVEEEINNFSILRGKEDYRTFGFNNEDDYRAALRTKVWYVWDRVTRRIYMYNDQDWSWPIWVWDDYLHLDTFFPITPMEFYTDPEEDIGKSEVMYYLDQQDAINEVNAEMRKIRRRIMGTIFYNTNIIKDTTLVDKWNRGEVTESIVGVNAPPEADMSKAFFAMLPPSANFVQMLDKRFYYDPIQRVSSVQPVMQGQQFKTNTTNEAIETYNSTQQTRLDEKIDAVEDAIGDVLWKVTQLCLQFMTQQEVAGILGASDAEKWQQLDYKSVHSRFSVRVVGGSSQKPTSRTKKQEAIQMVQALGQFAQAGQGVVILLMLKVMERAFDELTITEDDWAFLRTSIEQSIANSNPQGNPQGGTVPPGEADAGGNPVEQIAGLVNGLPPEVKQALGTALARGVPIEEALPRIMEMLQSQQAA